MADYPSPHGFSPNIALTPCAGEEAFTAFMDPGIDWYVPNAYLEAFADLARDNKLPRPDYSLTPPRQSQEQTMAEAGYTPNDGSHPPAYANVKFENDKATVTVRSGPMAGPEGGAMYGHSGTITMDIADFDQWIAEVLRERRRA